MGKAKPRPEFKAEYIVTHAITCSLAEGARVTAARLKMNKDETDGLVQRFVGYAIRAKRKTGAAVAILDLKRQPRSQSRGL
jgi:hypothetical protein